MSGLFAANDYLSHNTLQENVYPLYDNAPGSSTNTMTGIEAEFDNILPGLMSATQGSHTFIPSLSALDINSSNLNMQIFNAWDSDPTITPFDGIWFNGVTEEQPLSDNRPHVEITPQLIRWLSHELEANRYPLNTAGQSARYKNLQTIFNYGRPEMKFIYQLDVDNNGKLLVNNIHYGLDYDSLPPPRPGTNFTVYTNNSDCSPSWILVKNGGLVELGDDVSNAGELIVQSGTYMEIQSGGTLRLNDDSRVVIEQGADLILHPGAILELDGYNAQLEIRGRLVLKQNAVLAPSGTGFVKLNQPGMNYTNAQQMIVLEGNNHMDFSGTGKNHKRLEIGQTTFIRTELDSLVINDARVELDTGAYLHIRSPFTSNEVHYTAVNETGGAAAWHGGVRTYGQQKVSVSGCDFTHGSIGYFSNMNILGQNLILEDCTFKHNGKGLYTIGKSVNLLSCHLDSNNTGWHLQDYSGTNSVIGCSFDYNATHGILSNGQFSTSLTVLNNTTADWNGTQGVHMDQGTLQMSCFSASNNGNIGVVALNASLLMPDYSFNNFNNNVTAGLYFNNLDRLAMRDGQNAFSGSVYHFYGAFSQTGENNLYFDPVTGTRKLDVSLNLLPASGGVIPVDMNSPSYDPVLLYNWSSNPPWVVPECAGSGLNPIEAFCCGDSAGKISTTNYSEVSLNMALHDVASYMTDPLGTTPGDDLTATRRFAEIFAYIAQNSEGWNEWEQDYMDLGWTYWQRAVANAYRAGDIELNRGNPAIEVNADLLPLIEEADRRIQALDPYSDTYAEERFKVHLEKAQLYRLGEYHSEAIAILSHADQWSSEGHLAIANYWNCVCENELDLLTEQISVEDFENQMDVCVETWSSKRGSMVYPTGEGIPVALAMGGNGFRSVLLPNPSQGVSALSLNQNVSGLEVVVTDLNGTQVYREPVPKDRLTVELDGSAYPGGVYLVSVYEKDRLLETHKWVLTE